MDDRVRIYELARKMNVPNQDIINTLRELGYDIKSHSSTVDKIGQDKVIAAFAKKKQQPDGAEKGQNGKNNTATGQSHDSQSGGGSTTSTTGSSQASSAIEIPTRKTKR